MLQPRWRRHFSLHLLVAVLVNSMASAATASSATASSSSTAQRTSPDDTHDRTTTSSSSSSPSPLPPPPPPPPSSSSAEIPPQPPDPPRIGTHKIYSMLNQRSMPPPAPGSKSLPVHVGIYIESLADFRSQEMTFDVDIYLYMSWVDPRMRHNQSDYICVNDKNILDEIWLPDLYFSNSRTAYFHDVTVHNFNMFIAPNGTIAYGTRVTLNVACNLRLLDYPLDEQTCYINIISYAHVKEEMNVSWFSNGPVRYNPEIGLPEFKIGRIDRAYCDGVFNYTITEYSSRRGDFSCLAAVIQLKRAIGYHLVQSYIPTGRTEGGPEIRGVV